MYVRLVKGKKGFYPGLVEFSEAIRDLYNQPEYDDSILPRSPHHAYTVFVLNHADKLNQVSTRDELSDILFNDDAVMKSIISLTKKSSRKNLCTK